MASSSDLALIESLPSGIGIQRARLIPGFMQGAFEPLIGSTKFAEFNAGQSDRWIGLYTFVPTRGYKTERLMAWICRLKNSGTFWAHNPNHPTPVNGVVNGLTYDGAVGNLIGIGGGAPNSTVLSEGDLIQIGTQLFRLLGDLETDGSGDGAVEVWPAPRPGLEDEIGGDVITDRPALVARITSPVPQDIEPGRISQITISWEEAV